MYLALQGSALCGVSLYSNGWNALFHRVEHFIPRLGTCCSIGWNMLSRYLEKEGESSQASDVLISLSTAGSLSPSVLEGVRRVMSGTNDWKRCRKQTYSSLPTESSPHADRKSDCSPCRQTHRLRRKDGKFYWGAAAIGLMRTLAVLGSRHK